MWRDKLKRMMEELPEKYLKPKPIGSEAKMLIPPGSKPVSQLTEEEKRLDGVFRQLYDLAHLEYEAHNALYGEDENMHPEEACHKFNKQMQPRGEEMRLVSAILRRSLKERLGFENEYLTDNHDVYSVPPLEVQVVFHEPGDEPDIPDEVDIPGFKGWPETES